MILEDVEVGMRVVMRDNYDNSLEKGEIGTVISITDSFPHIAIEFDNPSQEKHSCYYSGEECKENHGYYVPPSMIKPYKN